MYIWEITACHSTGVGISLRAILKGIKTCLSTRIPQETDVESTHYAGVPYESTQDAKLEWVCTE